MLPRSLLAALALITGLGMTSPLDANTSVVNVVNDFRAQKGLAPLRHSKQLEAAAKRHARDMARRRFFSHRGSNGSNVAQRVRAEGYGYCFVAENIAMGQHSLNEVMQAWATSRGHRKNMLDRRAAEMALVKAENNIWVMVLGRPGC
jgi:uncharacterized protein YkwD